MTIIAAAVAALGQAAADDPSFGPPGQPQVSQDGQVGLVQIPLAGPATDAQGEAAVAAIERLRTDYVPRRSRERTARCWSAAAPRS